MKYSLFFFVLFCCNLFLFSQQDTLKTRLNEIVVTATRTETEIYKVANSVSVISSEEIEKSQRNSVSALLRAVPGITIVEQGGLGKLSNVFMRGANSNSTSVFLDGIKLNDPSSTNNAFDFSVLQS